MRWWRGSGRGYSLLSWSAFLSVVAVLMAFAIEAGRHARAAGEVQRTTDASSLAAVRLADIPHFRWTSKVRLNERTMLAKADFLIFDKAAYLTSRRINTHAVSIVLNQANETAAVTLPANLVRWAARWLCEQDPKAKTLFDRPQGSVKRMIRVVSNTLAWTF